MKYVVKLEEPKVSLGETWNFTALDAAMEFAREQIKTAKRDAKRQGMSKPVYMCFGIYKEQTGILYKIRTDADGDPLVVMY